MNYRKAALIPTLLLACTSFQVAADDDNPDHAPAGWYADPSEEPGLLRYWDGSDWTDHQHRIPDHNARAPRNSERSGLPRPPRS